MFTYHLFQGKKMAGNPWQVESILAFYVLKCPECEYNTKAEGNFVHHAKGNIVKELTPKIRSSKCNAIYLDDFWMIQHQFFDRESSKRSYKLLSWNLTLTLTFTKTFFFVFQLFSTS